MTPPTPHTDGSFLLFAQARVPAQAAPPPAVQGQASTGTATYIPVPVPALPVAQPSLASGVLLVFLIALLAVGARFLWRLPERMREKPWVRQLGGPYTVQNRALHGLGYLAFIGGVLTGNFTSGIMAAALMMIAANVRPQGEGAE